MVLESLNIAQIMIEYVFGGVLLTYAALLLIFVIICAICILTPTFMFCWLGLFSICFGAISLGGVVPMIGVIIAFIYCWQAIFKGTTGGY